MRLLGNQARVRVGSSWKLRPCLLAVLSHDCEFNERKRNKFLVARLQNMPGNLSGDERAALFASNDVRARVEANEPVAGVDTFALNPAPGVFHREQVISFTTITPLPIAMQHDLLDGKKLELTQERRGQLREKIAWFFGRDAEDIPDAHKSPAPQQTDSEAVNPHTSS